MPSASIQKKSSKKKSHKPQSAYATKAAQALALIAKAEDILAPDADLQPRDRKHANAMQRISADAMDKAIHIVESQPGSFPDFPVEEVRQAVAYDRAMSAVSDRAQALVAHLQTSMLKRRRIPASETLALYAALQGTARLRGDLYENVAQLGDLVAPHRVHRKKSASAKPSPKPAPASSSSAPPPAPATTPIAPAIVPVAPSNSLAH